MKTNIIKYGSRNWAIYDPQGNLLVVTVYKKGARRVAELLADLDGPSVYEDVKGSFTSREIPAHTLS